MRNVYNVMVNGDQAFVFDVSHADPRPFSDVLSEAISLATLTGPWRLTEVQDEGPGVHSVYWRDECVGRWRVEIGEPS